MSDETYNGWTNKPTWLVKLWIDNDQGSQEFWHELARINSDSIYEFSRQLQDYFEEAAPLVDESSLWSDLMSWAIAYVDWASIARSLIEDAVEVEA